MEKRQIIELALSPISALHWINSAKTALQHEQPQAGFLYILAWHLTWGVIYCIIKYAVFRNQPTGEELALGRNIDANLKEIALFALFKPYYYLLIGGIVVGTVMIGMNIFGTAG